MDLTVLATTVFGIVTPIVTNKKVQEFGKKVWGKVKPWFVIGEEETEELQTLRNNPDNEIAKKAFISKLELKLLNNPELQKEIETLINDAEKNGDEQTKVLIYNSKNVVTGNISHVQNLQIGDNIGTPNEKDNNENI